MKKILLDCRNLGISETLYAASIPERLQEKWGQNTKIDMWLQYAQPKLLLTQNTAIRKIFVLYEEVDLDWYDRIFTLPSPVWDRPITIQYQLFCDIHQPTTSAYTVLTNPMHDEEVASQYTNKNIKRIGIINNWAERSRQLEIDDIYTANHFARPRDIDTHVLDKLRPKPQNDFIEVHVFGLPPSMKTNDVIAQNPKEFSRLASNIKQMDFMIGPEGGLMALASGLGVTTITTTDYAFWQYGPRGTVTAHPFFQCGYDIYNGPRHFSLSPFIRDVDLFSTIRTIINYTNKSSRLL